MWTVGGWRDHHPFLGFQFLMGDEGPQSTQQKLHLSGRAIPIVWSSENDQVRFLNFRVNLSHPAPFCK